MGKLKSYVNVNCLTSTPELIFGDEVGYKAVESIKLSTRHTPISPPRHTLTPPIPPFTSPSASFLPALTRILPITDHSYYDVPTASPLLILVQSGYQRTSDHMADRP
jgi:hypothetical protein